MKNKNIIIIILASYFSISAEPSMSFIWELNPGLQVNMLTTALRNHSEPQCDPPGPSATDENLLVGRQCRYQSMRSTGRPLDRSLCRNDAFRFDLVDPLLSP